MKIKELLAKTILDSRKEKTIEIFVKTDFGLFSASSPSGKSKSKFEAAAYINTIEEDIEKISNLNFEELEINEFKDLIKIEKIAKEKIGANSLYALETAILKALAVEQGKQLWQIINENAKKLPFPVGNCIGGGLHTRFFNAKKPDFQEFLIIPYTRNFADNVFLMKKAKELAEKELKIRKSLGPENDENAFSTSLTNEEVLKVMAKIKDELEESAERKIGIGIDIAASTLYNGIIYRYKNPPKILKREEQISYIADLSEDFNLGYIEDALQENDFEGFSSLKKRILRLKPACLIVGDDLTASHTERVKKAIKENSVNAIILKPNQVGSLIEISEIVSLAKKYGLVTIFSHRSGETLDYSLADLAFGFQTDFIKTGISGKEREIKLRRLIEIEKSVI